MNQYEHGTSKQHEKHERKGLKFTTRLIIAGSIVAIVLGLYATKRIIDIPKKIIDDTEKTITDIGKAIKDILMTFTTGKITTEFRSYVTQAKGTNRLQVATVNTVETFTKTQELAYVWGRLKFSATVTITAPVEYTFYLELNDGWHFLINNEGNEQNPILKVYVLTPPIQYNTPAINVSAWTIRDDQKSIAIDEAQLIEQLRQELMKICQENAQRKIDDALRATIRQEVKKFITTWFIENRFKDSKIKPMIAEVYFEDEPLPKPVPELLKEFEKIDSKLLNDK